MGLGSTRPHVQGPVWCCLCDTVTGVQRDDHAAVACMGTLYCGCCARGLVVVDFVHLFVFLYSWKSWSDLGHIEKRASRAGNELTRCCSHP
jgi:hypothetical protein